MATSLLVRCLPAGTAYCLPSDVAGDRCIHRTGRNESGTRQCWESLHHGRKSGLEEALDVADIHGLAHGRIQLHGKPRSFVIWIPNLQILVLNDYSQSHGSQDLYPTMLTNEYNFSANKVTVTQVVANLGAMLGGTTVGYSSQIFGRRFSIVVMCVLGGALLYPYTYVSNNGVIAAAFFEQFCVQGAWGVIP
jgi:hypothetical protein